ncbi:hypothetical protein BC827DRAFT_1264301 [Russula dissimulans]|nr:hypothetical protein BC827DRAFT_1264301 [Russula dissimulans]
MSSKPHRLIRRTVLRYTASRRKLTLLSIPNDTLVDLILVHLCVRDILRLRSVCKLFYELTHQPMVWKRVLRTFHLPLPPLPPTIRYSFPALSSLEAERMVIRALAAEANWRSTMPKAYKAWSFRVFADVMSVKLVPGGKYAVASVREGTNRYALMLLMMEHRVKTAYPVAKIAIPSKAYQLEIVLQGASLSLTLITLSSIERFHHRIDVSDYSEDHIIDFPVPARYELNVLHCPLSALHIAEDPRFPPGSNAYTARIDAQAPPFRNVTVIRSNSAFTFTDFDMLDGAPYIIAVQGRLILFKNLVSRNVHRIRVGALFGYEEEVSEVHANRELLVVRTDRKDASMPLALELYKIPDDESSRADEVHVAWPRSVRFAWPHSVHTIATSSPLHHVTISAVPSSTDGEDVAAMLMEDAEPPPVSVYVVMGDPWHMMQFRLWPERVPKSEIDQFRPDSEWQAEIQAAIVAAAGDAVAVDGATPPTTPEGGSASPPPPLVPLKDTTFRFQLYGPFFKIISYKHIANATLGALRIHPGTTRPLLVVIQAGDRRATPALHDLWAYSDLVAPPAPHPRWPEDRKRRAAGEAERGWVDAALKSRSSPAAVAQLAPRTIREKFTRGLVAIEWDDWSMSMCGVCVDEPDMIYLFTLRRRRQRVKQDGHRFPLPVPDVDKRFREVSEKDPYAMSDVWKYLRKR